MVIDHSQWARLDEAPTDASRPEFILVGHWMEKSVMEELFICCNTLYRKRSWGRSSFGPAGEVWFQHIGAENANLLNESQRPEKSDAEVAAQVERTLGGPRPWRG